MKKSFTHALLAAAYIVTIVLIGHYSASIMPKEDNILMPMTMLGMLVLSVSVMGYLFISTPLMLYIDGQKKEALTFFMHTLGYFACFVLVFLVLMFLV